eukprot:TRINITY_DN18333_c0_g1_i1.p1 TRINITY_DN18333_c0_g1~~TRINITY_DN18333_c0_g1_i1.p1  ORF type:complete len:292 (+),score=7.58 TRINITY_DN18333_c0_g1_i1:56-877(+)
MAMAKVGRVAVVTGANKGVGYCIAKQLLDSGQFARVILACRNEELGRKAASELNGEFALLDLADDGSIDQFAHYMHTAVRRCDCLVNNAAIAFKGADPTPFVQQSGPTLRTNYWGTVALTDKLLPLIRCGDNPQIVNVASMAGKLSQISPPLQQQFTSASLDRGKLNALVSKFQNDVANGTHKANGWGSSNYGFSKLSLIAYTKLLAREESTANTGVKVNCCCPGYCKTDMSSHRGPRSPWDGAKNATCIALQGPGLRAISGEFVQDCRVSTW